MIGDRQHQTPVRRQAIVEAFRLLRPARPKLLDVVVSEARKPLLSVGKRWRVEVVEIRHTIRRQLPLHLNDDRAAESRVGKAKPFKPDSLRAEGLEELRLIRFGIASRNASAARPSRVDDGAKLRVVFETRVSLIDDQRRVPALDHAIDDGGDVSTNSSPLGVRIAQGQAGSSCRIRLRGCSPVRSANERRRHASTQKITHSATVRP